MKPFTDQNNKRLADAPAGGKQKKIKAEQGQCGLIDSITLQNFMCHDNLEFQFDPFVNFIIGQNGSGKSAVLTAIMLVLGARSSNTGRYTSLKGFIKNGRQKAKVEIVLLNGGNNAYKPDVYGNKIYIIREFKIDGTSGYKLKSSSGVIVSQHKEELCKILKHLNIKVDNPVCVLTQESSRNFLHSKQGAPENLYSFFFKGTSLEELSDSYEEMYAYRESNSLLLKKRNEEIIGLEKKSKEYKKLLDSNKKIADLQQELLWAEVKEAEQILEEKNIKFKKAEHEVKVHDKQIKDCSASIQSSTDELNTAKQEQQDSDAKRKELEDKLTRAKEKVDESHSHYKDYKMSYELIKNRRLTQEKHVKALQKSVEEMQSRDPNDVDEENKKRLSDIAMLQSKVQKVRNGAQELEGKKKDNFDQEQNIQKEKDALSSECIGLKYKLDRSLDEVRKCKRITEDRLTAFGENVPRILARIKEQKRSFKHLPVGPIGLYVEVKDERWIPSVERCIGQGLLQSFCCDNHQDAQQLKRIFRECGGKAPSIVTSPFGSKIHDVSRFKVQCPFPAMLDMLKFSHVVVANCLIDQSRIESRLLIEDVKQAQDCLMYNPPANVISAYLLNQSEICLNPYRVYGADQRRKHTVLGSIDKDKIAHLQQEVEEIRNTQRTKNAELNALENQLQSFHTMNTQINREIMSLKSKERELREKIKELESVEPPKNVASIQEDLEKMRAEWELYRTEESQWEVKMTKTKGELRQLLAALEVLKKQLEEERTLYSQIMQRVNKSNRILETFRLGKKKYEDETKQLQAKARALHEDLQQNKQTVEELVKNAEDVCPRMDTDKNSENLRRLLEETQRQIQKQNKMKLDEVATRYKELFRKIEDAHKERNSVLALTERFGKMLDIRRKYFKQITVFTQSCVKTAFTDQLTINNYLGNIDFNTEKRTLKLQVNPRRDCQGSGATGTLSGGEKSFTTVCLLVALWDRVQSPFKILDEYDVFMDSNNRKMSLDLLIEHSNQCRTTQYLFLSPLELPQMKESPFIKVHKMPAPQRANAFNP